MDLSTAVGVYAIFVYNVVQFGLFLAGSEMLYKV